LVISALPEVLAAPTPTPAEAFFSKIFQNLRLSSAAVRLSR